MVLKHLEFNFLISLKVWWCFRLYFSLYASILKPLMSKTEAPSWNWFTYFSFWNSTIYNQVYQIQILTDYQFIILTLWMAGFILKVHLTSVSGLVYLLTQLLRSEAQTCDFEVTLILVKISVHTAMPVRNGTLTK